jgi:hypothetical protein
LLGCGLTLLALPGYVNDFVDQAEMANDWYP